MDKQDFQEQDFMEILMRLPCTCKDNTFYSRSETILFASRNIFAFIRQQIFIRANNLKAHSIYPTNKDFLVFF